MFKWSIAAGLLFIPAFAIGLQWGITGVAASYGVASLLLFWPSLAIPFRLVDLRVSDVLLKLLPTMVSAAVMALVVASIAAAWPDNTGNQLVRLILLIVVGMVTYVGLSLLFQRTLLKDLIRAALSR
jgi:PST family polysaccharide transporter